MHPTSKQNITISPVVMDDAAFLTPDQRFPGGRFYIAPENRKLIERAARALRAKVEFVPAGERLAVQAGDRCDQLVERFKELQVRSFRRPRQAPLAERAPAPLPCYLKPAPKPTKTCLTCPATIEFRSPHQFVSQKYCAECAGKRIKAKQKQYKARAKRRDHARRSQRRQRK